MSSGWLYQQYPAMTSEEQGCCKQGWGTDVGRVNVGNNKSLHKCFDCVHSWTDKVWEKPSESIPLETACV